MLTEHRPDDVLAARLEVFDRWPTSGTAAELHGEAGEAWPRYRDDVERRLASGPPRDAVLFALLTLRDVQRAWDLAHALDLRDDDVWADLAAAYEEVDAAAALPVHERLVRSDLGRADAQRYRAAARRLARMRALVAGTPGAAGVDDLVGRLREEHRRRPRLQQEFTRAGLP